MDGSTHAHADGEGLDEKASNGIVNRQISMLSLVRLEHLVIVYPCDHLKYYPEPPDTLSIARAAFLTIVNSVVSANRFIRFWWLHRVWQRVVILSLTAYSCW